LPTKRLTGRDRGADSRSTTPEDVLARLAKTSGLDGTGLRAALAEHRFEESVLADVREAGTFLLRAVPAFAAGEKAVECGVQSLQQLRNLVARARSD
jgi:predicted DsbA family dithiol-disulfide isomerase